MSAVTISQQARYQTKVTLKRATSEPLWVRVLLISTALLFLALFLLVPLAAVFCRGFAQGFFNLYYCTFRA